jgi:hypothetical protein
MAANQKLTEEDNQVLKCTLGGFIVDHKTMISSPEQGSLRKPKESS